LLLWEKWRAACGTPAQARSYGGGENEQDAPARYCETAPAFFAVLVDGGAEGCTPALTAGVTVEQRSWNSVLVLTS